MSATTGSNPRQGVAVEYKHFSSIVQRVASDFDDAQIAPIKSSTSKSLNEEHITDLLFYGVVFIFGVWFKTVPWASVLVHGVSSIVAIICLTTLKQTVRAHEQVSVVVSTCSSAAGLTDALFIVQLVCRATGNGDDEPSAFAFGTKADDTILLSVLLALHATSVLAAVYRIRRVSSDLNTEPTLTSLGIAIASSLVYLVWNTDINGPAGQILHPHTITTGVLCIVTIVDVIVTFADGDRSRRHAWWIAAVGLALQYVVLLLSITYFMDDINLGKTTSSILSHHYSGQFAKVQAIGILTVYTVSTAYRTLAAAPRSTARSGYVESSDVIIRTPASNADIEPFASGVATVTYIALATLPFTTAVIALFGDRNPALSRFSLLLYVSFLSLRLWIQARTTQPWLLFTTSILGILLDAFVCVDIVIISDGLVLYERNKIETYTLLVIATTSTIVCIVHLSHYTAQYLKLNEVYRLKCKKK
jgi:hypothetical protein